MTTHVPVAVIGAGPTGMTVATLLAQCGIETLVLDRWRDVYPQPRAVHLDDEVYQILARVGIADRFAAISRPALGLQLVDEHHRVLARFRRRIGRHGFPQANMFDQPELERLLRDNLTHYPQIRMRGGVEVIDLAPGTPARLTLADGEVITCDYVLGCDGANSLVRTRIGAVMQDLKFDQRWLVVDIATGADLQQWDGVHQVCSAHRAATYMRIGETRYRWEFQLLAEESASDYTGLDALHPFIAPWVPEGTELELVRVTEYTFRAQLADRWRRDNVFLLGDAAHLTPPFIGQGMGAGLRDAMNLAGKLAGVINGELDAEVLNSYERERKPHARNMIRLALIVGRAMTAGGRTGDRARHALAAVLTIPRVTARRLRGKTVVAQPVDRRIP
ncbi:hypothetical protein ASE48_03765 [Mycobacterium sp. Root265]|nr:bifunctional 3-(3-hydroxy-phenyl)propionate/3-hydroxycinnamic acid hydroxylase [Mycobacterium sp. Root265]KRD14148.1 hypothetical protein ASE48_03765 [Mycobacterium sp. Root265]